MDRSNRARWGSGRGRRVLGRILVAAALAVVCVLIAVGIARLA
jgi:hypothetical protein